MNRLTLIIRAAQFCAVAAAFLLLLNMDTLAICALALMFGLAVLAVKL